MDGENTTGGNQVDAMVMRDLMRYWATGVTVVAAQHKGVSHGMTVSSFTSVSVDPPLVLVSLQRQARTHSLVQASAAFGVTILQISQQEVAERFAGRMENELERFDGLKIFTMTTGAPLLLDGLAAFDCQVVEAYPVGDHTLFIGEVVALNLLKEGEPLVYCNRSYWSLKKDSE
ncbi:MAG: flavin reductase family protein [Chloroflexota bacterium]